MEMMKKCDFNCHIEVWQKMTFVSMEEKQNHQRNYEINFTCIRCGNKVKEFFTHKQLSDLMAYNKWREECLVAV